MGHQPHIGDWLAKVTTLGHDRRDEQARKGDQTETQVEPAHGALARSGEQCLPRCQERCALRAGRGRCILVAERKHGERLIRGEEDADPQQGRGQRDGHAAWIGAPERRVEGEKDEREQQIQRHFQPPKIQQSDEAVALEEHKPALDCAGWRVKRQGDHLTPDHPRREPGGRAAEPVEAVIGGASGFGIGNWTHHLRPSV